MSTPTLATLGNQIKVEFYQALRDYEDQNNYKQANFVQKQQAAFKMWGRAVRLWDEQMPMEGRADDSSVRLLSITMTLLKEQVERLNRLPSRNLRGKTDGPSMFLSDEIERLGNSVTGLNKSLEEIRERCEL